jgi:hypothetical protein
MADVEARGSVAAIRDAMRDIQAAEVELRAEQDAAWRRYVERVDAILAYDLQVDGVPDDEDDDDHDPSHLVDGLRTLVGDLRVKAHLGAMEGEELVERVRTALRRMAT